MKPMGNLVNRMVMSVNKTDLSGSMRAKLGSSLVMLESNSDSLDCNSD